MTYIDDSYGISLETFNEFFTENLSEGSFDELKAAAKNGNAGSIDMLHNMALRKDSRGDDAEKVLYDLFTGNLEGRIGIRKDIQMASEKLCGLMSSVIFKDKNPDFKEPRAILYMAGHGAQAGSQMRNQLADRLIASGLDEKNYWANNRYIDDVELSVSTKALMSNLTNYKVNAPVELEKISTLSLSLNEMLGRAGLGDKDFLVQPEIFPLHVKDHWILFVAYKTSEGKAQRLVLDSKPPLKEASKTALSETDKLLGVEGDGHYVGRDLQEHVPNGCGLFVYQAIKTLVEDTRDDPLQVINQFVESFLNLTAEEQAACNTDWRETLLAAKLLYPEGNAL